jgi:hypothetical protein
MLEIRRDTKYLSAIKFNKNRFKSTARTFSYTAGFDHVRMETKSIFVR